jgi:hypothetical protein
MRLTREAAVEEQGPCTSSALGSTRARATGGVGEVNPNRPPL